MNHPRKAVVLSSGGLDSTTCLAIARAEGFETYSLTFDYGQRHRAELAAAERCATMLGAARHLTVSFDLRAMGGSALTADIAVPKDRDEAAMGGDIPVTYVPARNTIFLSFGLAWAETLNASAIYVGVNALDYSGYPDCRPEYIASFQALARLATKAGVEGSPITIHAPLLHLTKAQIIRRGLELGVDYGATHSCYDPSPEGLACGHCDSCQLRRAGFEAAGAPDPTRYAAS